MVNEKFNTIVPHYKNLKRAISPLLFVVFLSECLSLISQALISVIFKGIKVKKIIRQITC